MFYIVLNDLMVNYGNHKEENKNDEKEDFNKEIENCCRENLLYLLKYFHRATLKSENEFLIIASKHGNKDVVFYLLENEIDVNQQKKENKNDDEELSRGTTALTVASEQGHEVIVQMLLYHKDIDINQQSEDSGKTALMWASEKGHVEIVKMLLEKDNIDINQKDKYGGRTALMCASEEGHKEIVKILLEKDNIEINQTNIDGETALMFTSQLKDIYLLHIQLKKLFFVRKKFNMVSLLSLSNLILYAPTVISF